MINRIALTHSVEHLAWNGTGWTPQFLENPSLLRKLKEVWYILTCKDIALGDFHLLRRLRTLQLKFFFTQLPLEHMFNANLFQFGQFIEMKTKVFYSQQLKINTYVGTYIDIWCTYVLMGLTKYVVHTYFISHYLYMYLLQFLKWKLWTKFWMSIKLLKAEK